MISAPDYSEPILGWRAWHAVESRGEIYLMSLFHRVRWPCLQPLEGVCSAPRLPRLRRRSRHTAPADRCHCGIYASSLETASTYITQTTVRRTWPSETVWPVIGEVALWGEVVECTNGWRASFAYPQRLFLVAEERTLETVRLRKGLERYGVPIDVIDTPVVGDADVVAFVRPLLGRSAIGWSAGINRALQ